MARKAKLVATESAVGVKPLETAGFKFDTPEPGREDTGWRDGIYRTSFDGAEAVLRATLAPDGAFLVKLGGKTGGTKNLGSIYMWMRAYAESARFKSAIDKQYSAFLATAKSAKRTSGGAKRSGVSPAAIEAVMALKIPDAEKANLLKAMV